MTTCQCSCTCAPCVDGERGIAVLRTMTLRAVNRADALQDELDAKTATLRSCYAAAESQRQRADRLQSENARLQQEIAEHKQHIRALHAGEARV